jgi:uncharacterized protein (DUF488 family)
MSNRGPGLVSVGYEGRTVDDLVEVMVAQSVQVVADVRLTPLSRKPGLSKTKLSAALAEAGVEYLHFRPLGNPRENRAPFANGSVETGVRRFQELMKEPTSSACLDELAELARTHRVAVLCFERDHDRCHRQVVTAEVASRSAATTVALA